MHLRKIRVCQACFRESSIQAKYYFVAFDFLSVFFLSLNSPIIYISARRIKALIFFQVYQLKHIFFCQIKVKTINPNPDVVSPLITVARGNDLKEQRPTIPTSNTSQTGSNPLLALPKPAPTWSSQNLWHARGVF